VPEFVCRPFVSERKLTTFHSNNTVYTSNTAADGGNYFKQNDVNVMYLHSRVSLHIRQRFQLGEGQKYKAAIDLGTTFAAEKSKKVDYHEMTRRQNSSFRCLEGTESYSICGATFNVGTRPRRHTSTTC